MKKGIVALLIFLALVVLVSPAFVGWLAERSVNEQIEWADKESGDTVIVTAERFDRGWLSSEGRHRVELRNTPNLAAAKTMLGMHDSEELPTLVIDTRLDHGIIPVGSLGREHGSLAPGLGSAVSTLSIESPDGDVIELPGAIYSNIGLDGDLLSEYKLEPGSRDDVEWGATSIDFSADPSDRSFVYDGEIEFLRFANVGGSMDLSALTFAGDLTQTDYGIPVGTTSAALQAMEVETETGVPMTIGPMSFDSTTTIDGDRLASDATVNFSMSGVPQMDVMTFDMKVAVTNADAAALGRLNAAADAMPAGGDPTMVLSAVEEELKDVLAAGVNLKFERLNISIPQGDINAVINVDVSESDRATFEWTSLLLAMNADARLQVSESLVMMAQMMSPDAGQLEQFLVKDGDVYIVEAAYQRGVMTVNGVPLALPVQ